jgi:hypothetical protein
MELGLYLSICLLGIVFFSKLNNAEEKNAHKMKYLL